MAEAAHTYIRHGQVAVCGGCNHQCRVTRFVSEDEYPANPVWLCAPCVAAGKLPEGYVIESWCSDCEQTIPEAARLAA